MRIALSAGATLSDEVRQTRGWKLLLLLPRMLLFRPPRGGLIPPSTIVRQIHALQSRGLDPIVDRGAGVL